MVSRTKTSRGWAVKGFGPVKYFKTRTEARKHNGKPNALVFTGIVAETISQLLDMGFTAGDIESRVGAFKLG